MEQNYLKAINNLIQRGIPASFNATIEEFGDEKKGVRLDIEGLNLMGRLVLWETGECNLDVLELESESQVLFENSIVTNVAELESKYQKLLSALKIGK